MLVLCGSPISSYYNKVKLALLEKGVPFEEELVGTGATAEDVLAASPLAKIPFIRTDQGTLCESQAILDYLEAAYPEPPLLPAEPYAAAKVHELILFIDLHLELVARQLYPQAFFGGTLRESTVARLRGTLEKNIGGFRRLARFKRPTLPARRSPRPTAPPGRRCPSSRGRPRRCAASTSSQRPGSTGRATREWSVSGRAPAGSPRTGRPRCGRWRKAEARFRPRRRGRAPDRT